MAMGGEGSTRGELIARVAADVLALPSAHVRRVAVDGVDGAGKTHFADELARELTARGTIVIRASVDGFHNPPQVRYRRGRSSPEGFFRDSYDYERMIRLLLAPLSPGGSGRYVRQVYDVHAERAVASPVEQAVPEAVLVFDGIFVHRDVLVGFWDYSVWLEVPFAVSVPRGAQRGYGDADLGVVSNRRYIEGQRLYVAECDPQARATVVIDNEHLDRPVMLRHRDNR